MPLPSWLRPRAPPTRWKRSNSRGSSASGIPTPLSATSITARSPIRTRSSIRPSSVNL